MAEIPRIPSKDMSSQRFYEDYMIPNRPVIITDLVDGWDVLKWVDGSGRLKTAHVKENFGKSEVTVHNCSNQIRDMGRLETKCMSVGQYLDWWESRSQSCEDQSAELLYLKDWNFCKEFPG